MRASRVVVTLSLAAFASSATLASTKQQKTQAAQVVDLKASDGVILKASYFPAAAAGPGILLLHACNRDRTSWTQLASDAAARGFHVLTIDFRGFGQSGGARFEPGPGAQETIDNVWPGDVDAAFAWLTSQPGVDKSRIAAGGASCGVNQSVLLAKRHPEVKTLVLLSGGVNDRGREYLRDTSWLPVFASASHGDNGAVDTMRWVLGWSRNTSNKFVEYKAAGHGTDMFNVEKGLEPMILTWLDAHLRNAPAATSATAAASKPTAVEEFWTALNAPGGVDRARKMYADAKARNKNVLLFPEAETNLLGYQLLQNGNAKDAVALFQMNVEAYPNSANTYDSLSDGYVALGNRDLALKNAEKAIQMLGQDAEVPADRKQLIRESAQKKVKELKPGGTSDGR